MRLRKRAGADISGHIQPLTNQIRETGADAVRFMLLHREELAVMPPGERVLMRALLDDVTEALMELAGVVAPTASDELPDNVYVVDFAPKAGGDGA